MLTLSFGTPLQTLRRLLVVGAHADDIEIGCGGTVLRLLDESPDLEVWWVVFSASGVRGDEARASASGLLRRVNEPRIVLHTFRDGFLPFEGKAVKEQFEWVKTAFDPDLVLTHHSQDAHQDHRVVSELTWNTFRDHAILEFEIPKYDGDLGRPNFYVRLTADQAHAKVEHLLRAFPSQHTRRWFSAEVFLALMRIRGMECNAPSSYAEAFYTRKSVM
jgi:LmbE family N-acetylglucosaminyl deacetylase